jgi:hypothetical protein
LIALAVAVVAVVGAIAGLALTSGKEDRDQARPAGAPGSGQPSPAPTGAPEDVLRGLINTAMLKDCQSKSTIDSKWADAGLSCTGAEGVPVSAYHFESQSALDRQIGALADHFADEGDCDSGQSSIDEWTTPQEPTGGAKLCYHAFGKFVIYWFYTEDRIAFAAEDRSPTRLAAWWHRFDPVKH